MSKMYPVGLDKDTSDWPFGFVIQVAVVDFKIGCSADTKSASQRRRSDLLGKVLLRALPENDVV